jgi:hypothetical protein
VSFAPPGRCPYRVARAADGRGVGTLRKHYARWVPETAGLEAFAAEEPALSEGPCPSGPRAEGQNQVRGITVFPGGHFVPPNPEGVRR